MSDQLTATTWQIPCASMLTAGGDRTRPHASWDLDVGDGPAWARAIEICGTCPLQVACRQQLAQDYPGALHGRPSRSPRGVIWAGVAYSEGGRALRWAELRVLAVQRRNAAAKGTTHAA